MAAPDGKGRRAGRGARPARLGAGRRRGCACRRAIATALAAAAAGGADVAAAAREPPHVAEGHANARWQTVYVVVGFTTQGYDRKTLIHTLHGGKECAWLVPSSRLLPPDGAGRHTWAGARTGCLSAMECLESGWAHPA